MMSNAKGEEVIPMVEFSLFDTETTRPSAAMYDPCVYNPDCDPWWPWGGI